MSVATEATRPTTRHRPPPWRDVRVLRVAFQVAVLGLIALLLWFLVSNLLFNLRRLGINTSFDFLNQPAGFRIPFSDFRPSQPFKDALLVGVENTAIVSFAGIGLATVLGIVVGVARLSTNWLVRRAAAAYVESLRNVPVLVIIIFWYLGVMLRLPPINRAVEIADVVVVSNRGVVAPGFTTKAGISIFVAFGLGGLALAALVGWWRTRRFDLTGQPHHRVLWGLGILAAVLVVGYFVSGAPFTLSLPEVEQFGVAGGFSLRPEFAALLIALTIYTASHIAEIVRGSILAVQKGQKEAADALGLSGFQRLRFVVLPQAFRIIIPPLANQYLNLTKNSSLAVAIAFPEITRITRIAIGQAAPAPQAIGVLMAIYLAFSLFIALVANLINRRIQVKER